ncbi:MAG: hypothetical protein ABSH00_18990 [Bryobacteraceae bacterium]|jgi:predicted nucleic-acid-binding Zn-ribbon protein
MKNRGVCPKCGSTAIIRSARLQRVAESRVPVKIAVDGNPDAFLRKETEHSDLEARVCSQCGYVELYAADVAPLSSAYEMARSNTLHLTGDGVS